MAGAARADPAGKSKTGLSNEDRRHGQLPFAKNQEKKKGYGGRVTSFTEMKHPSTFYGYLTKIE